MSQEAEAGAREALDAYFVAWNAADVPALRKTLNYPFLTIGPAGQVITHATPEDHEVDFDALRAREGWGSSTLDAADVIGSSGTKVTFVCAFSRYHPDGSRYGGGRVVYIMTLHDGHWGMQARSGL